MFSSIVYAYIENFQNYSKLQTILNCQAMRKIKIWKKKRFIEIENKYNT